MHNIFNYLKYIGMFLLSLIILSTLFSILNIIGLNPNITSILNIISMVIIFFSLGFIEGRKAIKRGYLTGLKTGLIYLAFIFLINIILFHNPFRISTMIYYMILIISSIFGSMIGINKKKEK